MPRLFAISIWQRTKHRYQYFLSRRPAFNAVDSVIYLAAHMQMASPDTAFSPFLYSDPSVAAALLSRPVLWVHPFGVPLDSRLYIVRNTRVQLSVFLPWRRSVKNGENVLQRFLFSPNFLKSQLLQTLYIRRWNSDSLMFFIFWCIFKLDPSVERLGITFDPNLSFATHIHNIGRSCFTYRRYSQRLCPLLSFHLSSQ